MRKDLIIITLLSIATVLFLHNCGQRNTQFENEEGPVHETTEVVPEKLEYGLPVDSFTVIESKIKNNQSLSDILINYGVSPQTIDSISHMNGDFNVRQIRAGNIYRLFLSKDSVPKLQYFIYEHSQLDYVMISFSDSLGVFVGQKPTVIEKKIASGIIRTNLWDAMVDNNINPMMSIELSEIYAWSIDFFGLQKGDQFYVIYEERLLDSVSAGIERIHAALFNHQNKDYYAIYFVQDNEGSYFDEDGNSLRKAFLKAPLKYNRISSRFSNNRYHPVLKIYRPHTGVDYAAPEGTPVYSIGDGFVVNKGYQNGGAGNYVKVKHNSVYTTQYAHLREFAKDLKVGDHVNQGQLLGYVGHTGLATGPHLDFRFFKNGYPVDPLKVDAPSVEPVKKINRQEFDKIMKEFVKQLDDQKKAVTASK
jgi:murein DD-endopeptidase MepM/ murein hydrolase activator NlpD